MPKHRQTKKSKTTPLAHSKHTGKLLPKRHTSYPALAFILLLVGVLIIGLDRSVQAADVNVTASIAGTPPSQPALITSPADGSHIVDNPLLPVHGSCPTATVIELYDNNLFGGSTLCAADGTFALTTELNWGINRLQTKIYNLGNNQGPDSPIITVYLDHSATSSANYNSSSSSTNAPLQQPPFSLQTNIAYGGYAVGENVNWKLSVVGGIPPYAVSVDWGDGLVSVLSLARQGDFGVNHSYKHAGGYHGLYPIKISASDVGGQTAYIQVFVLVNNNLAASGTVGNTNANSGFSLHNSAVAGTIHIAWDVYVASVMMAVSFWLGERRGLSLGKRFRRPTWHPRHP